VYVSVYETCPRHLAGAAPLTAQVAIFTGSAAVLAADSAVTVSGNGGRKVYVGAEKIYPLSERSPIAALVYGIATLLDIPWATLLSEYRVQFGDEQFKDMETAARRLVTFLRRRLGSRIRSEGRTMREARAYGLVATLLETAREDTLAAFNSGDSAFEFTADGLTAALEQRLGEIARAEREEWARTKRLPDVTAAQEQELHKSARSWVNAVRRQVLGDLSPDLRTRRAITDLVLLSFTRRSPDTSRAPTEGGLVLVGFPVDEFWPKYIELTFDGVGLEGVRHWVTSDGGCNGPHDVEIRAFAQRDGVATMMNGVNPEFWALLLDRLLARGLDRRRVLDALEDARSTWADQRTNAVLDTLDVLPEPHLCEIAESLVSITALWQRMRGTLETVGGAVSVATLTPGGPLRWAKRPNLTSS
jgi:hypothetical protein